MVLKEWKEKALTVFWSNTQLEFTNRAVCDHGNQRLRPESISRASIINLLEDRVSLRLLSKTEATGKGGYRGVYSTKVDDSGFKKFIAETAIEALMRNFPDETKQIIDKLR